MKKIEKIARLITKTDTERILLNKDNNDSKQRVDNYELRALINVLSYRNDI